MNDRLARRYGYWPRFYPPGPRREEMLATLLECCRPGWPWCPAGSPRRAAACTPSGPPGDLPPAEVAHSRMARVYIAQDSADEQRNFAEAAIARVWGSTSFSFPHDPTGEEYPLRLL